MFVVTSGAPPYRTLLVRGQRGIERTPKVNNRTVLVLSNDFPDGATFHCGGCGSPLAVGIPKEYLSIRPEVLLSPGIFYLGKPIIIQANSRGLDLAGAMFECSRCGAVNEFLR